MRNVPAYLLAPLLVAVLLAACSGTKTLVEKPQDTAKPGDIASESSIADGTGNTETGTSDGPVDSKAVTGDSADGTDIEGEEIPVDWCVDVDCDDQLECTDDTCKDGVCTSDLVDDCCLIDGKHYAAGDPVSKYSCHGCQPQQDQFAWSHLPDGTLCGSSEDPSEWDYQECHDGLCCNPYAVLCWDAMCNCSGLPMYGNCETECAMVGFDAAAHCLMLCGGDCCNEDSDCLPDKPSCVPLPTEFWGGDYPTGRCVSTVQYPQCWTVQDCEQGQQCLDAPQAEDCPFCDVPCPDLEPGVCTDVEVCGDGFCTASEHPYNCPEDCGPGPENGICEAWETCQTSPEDCGPCCPDTVCEPEYDEDCESCPEDCPCQNAEVCFDGTCCLPECDDNCGDDGCGGSCSKPMPEGCFDWLPPDECSTFGGYSWYMWCPDDGPCACGCPTGDAGCPCTSSAQCQGVCVTYPDEGGGGFPGQDYCAMLDEGVCSYYHYMLGCMCVLDGNGKPDGGCSD